MMIAVENVVPKGFKGGIIQARKWEGEAGSECLPQAYTMNS